MAIIEIILMALSLSVDTLVVSMCGSVTLGKINFGNTAKVAMSFALMQTALLSAGWLFGNSIVKYIEKPLPCKVSSWPGAISCRRIYAPSL